LNSADRLLSILRLFTVAKPEWTVEDAARQIGVSLSQTYRYFNSLVKAGLLDSSAGPGLFSLGPAFLEYDRQIRLCDPMLRAARPIMQDLADQAPPTATILLCRRYQDLVMCVAQVVGRAPQAPVGYERGRPMRMLHGASSKVVLAHLPGRNLRRVYNSHQEEIAGMGLGGRWEEFRAQMAEIRKRGYCHSVAEVDPGRTGIAAAVFDAKGGVLGSVGMALLGEPLDEAARRRLTMLCVAAARDIEFAMARLIGDAGAAGTAASDPAKETESA
jgi:DNA-binding IclR family transcriptional regulator